MNKSTKSLNKTSNEKNLFNNGYNYYKFFWIFLMGCITGVILETLWCLITTKQLQSRTALVLGFFNPIYGIGAILMTLEYIKLKEKNNILIFIICMVIGGLFEALCSLLQEKIFGTVSWYYDTDSLGILWKRTSVTYCILWGLLGLIWIKLLYPIIESHIEKIPNKIGFILTWVFTIFLSFDIALSVAAVYRQSERRNDIQANNLVRTYLDQNYNDDKLKSIYPNMTVVSKK